MKTIQADVLRLEASTADLPGILTEGRTDGYENDGERRLGHRFEDNTLKYYAPESSVGSSGYSGYSGYSGSEGLPGGSGAPGVSGISGYSGSNGSSGYSGYSGYSGSEGPAGSSGANGNSGHSGYSGPTLSGLSTGYHTYANGSTSIVTGPINTDGTQVAIGTTSSSADKLKIVGSLNTNSVFAIGRFSDVLGESDVTVGTNSVYGYKLTISVSQTDTPTTAIYGEYLEVKINGDYKKVTNYYGKYIKAPSFITAHQTMTNFYGLYVEDTNIADNNYCAYFGGKVGIGVNPSEMLDISGNIKINRSSDDVTPSSMNFYKTRIGVPIVTGDALGSISAYGYDGTNYIQSGAIKIASSDTITTNQIPGNVDIWTHPNSTSAMRKIARFSSDAKLYIYHDDDTAKYSTLETSAEGRLKISSYTAIVGFANNDVYIDSHPTNEHGIAYQLDVDADTVGTINYYGYNNANTRYRDLAIYNGKAALLCTFSGASNRVTVQSGVEVFLNLPTSAGTNGSLWNNSGTVMVSNA